MGTFQFYYISFSNISKIVLRQMNTLLTKLCFDSFKITNEHSIIVCVINMCIVTEKRGEILPNIKIKASTRIFSSVLQ